MTAGVRAAEALSVHAPTTTGPGTPAPRLLPWWALASVATGAASVVSLFAVRAVAGTSPSPVLEALGSLLWVGIAIGPLIVAVKGAIFAAIVWAVLELQLEDVSYRSCLAAVWAGELAIAGGALWQGLVGLLRQPGSAEDLIVPVGLDLFLEPTSAAAALLARSVNVCLLAWIAIVLFRLTGRFGARSARAAFLAVVVGAAAMACVPLLSLIG
jgi:hypothetical protein